MQIIFFLCLPHRLAKTVIPPIPLLDFTYLVSFGNPTPNINSLKLTLLDEKRNVCSHCYSELLDMQRQQEPHISLPYFPFSGPRIWELRTQKLKSHLMRTQSLKVLPLKPGLGQYIAMPATLTARVFFLANFYPSGPFTCILSKTSPDFFLCWLWLTPVPV